MHMRKKTYKRNIETWKTYSIWSGGGLMVSPIHQLVQIPYSTTSFNLVCTFVQRMTKLIIIYLTNKPTYSIFAASHICTPWFKGNLVFTEWVPTSGLFVNKKLSNLQEKPKSGIRINFWWMVGSWHHLTAHTAVQLCHTVRPLEVTVDRPWTYGCLP